MLDRLQIGLQRLQARQAQVLRDLRSRVRQGLLHLLQAHRSAALLFNQSFAVFLESLQIPFGLLQGLTLPAHLGFRGIPGPALAAEALLQVALLLLKLFALVLEVALLLAPGPMGAG